jgi:glycosyltransferase involved in cell wall biosynthesis
VAPPFRLRYGAVRQTLQARCDPRGYVLKPTISVIMPAYRAAPYIAEGVRSVLDQTNPDWLLFVVSDDGIDYEAVLGEAGLSDSRLRFLSSGAVGGGASRARNLALEVIDTPHAAILDADDRLKPQKLERVAEALDVFPIVTTALEVMDDSYRTLRHIGHGPDQALSPADHKFVSFSMDSMVSWDRRRCDARYDHRTHQHDRSGVADATLPHGRAELPPRHAAARLRQSLRPR